MTEFFEDLEEWCLSSLQTMRRQVQGLKARRRALNLPNVIERTAYHHNTNEGIRDGFEALPDLPFIALKRQPATEAKRKKRKEKPQENDTELHREEKRARMETLSHRVSEVGTREMPIEIDDVDDSPPSQSIGPDAPLPSSQTTEPDDPPPPPPPPPPPKEDEDCILIDEEEPEAQSENREAAAAGGSRRRESAMDEQRDDPVPSPSDDQPRVMGTKQPLPREVEEKEWQERHLVIAAQRREAVRLKQELRMQSRMEEQLTKYRKEEEEKARQAAEKERMRWTVKKELDYLYGDCIKARKLHHLLYGLGIPIEGGDLNKALRLAKIRHHPDKAKPLDLKNQVFSEEISKILNGWTL